LTPDIAEVARCIDMALVAAQIEEDFQSGSTNDIKVLAYANLLREQFPDLYKDRN
jgi:hypothetical protein